VSNVLRLFLCIDGRTRRVRRYVDGKGTGEIRTISGYGFTLATELDHFRLFGLPAYTRITS
jgi:hypothetical protein